jgi:murein DD-endopeptidase MepM/ murein hydrolase activator NlpD
VVWAHDGATDRPPRSKVRHDSGNFVIIEHAPDELTELRHLRLGSLLVKVGERVVRGQRVAQCGNSGNAGTPHLHVGLLGSANPIATRPMRFSRYEVLGADGVWHPGDGVPALGQILRSVDGGPPAP